MHKSGGGGDDKVDEVPEAKGDPKAKADSEGNPDD